jgi:bacterioferritin-associated ferredoxin
LVAEINDPATMILCSCNVLSDRAIREVLASPNPPRTPCQVHHHLGCKARCGRCVRTMREMIDEAKPVFPMPEESEAQVA